MSLLKVTTEIPEYYYNWHHGIQFSRTLFSPGYGVGLLLPLIGNIITCVLPSTRRFDNINGTPSQLEVDFINMVTRR